jgi:hypothetical protein
VGTDTILVHSGIQTSSDLKSVIDWLQIAKKLYHSDRTDYHSLS